MTVLIEQVQALLDPLAAGGAWYGINTVEPPTYPYIVWQRVVSTPNVWLSGPSLMQNTRIQVDIYARRISEAETVANAVETAMAAWSVQNVPLSSQDLYDEEVKAHRVSKDYSLWSTA